VSVLQFAEGLSDRQAADAVRSWIHWKYALGLKLDDPGFDASVLCEFRSRLIAGKAEMLLFETLLSLLREQGLLKARGKQRTDSTHVLAAIRMLNRLECVGETLRHALNVLATVAPDWLHPQQSCRAQCSPTGDYTENQRRDPLSQRLSDTHGPCLSLWHLAGSRSQSFPSMPLTADLSIFLWSSLNSFNLTAHLTATSAFFSVFWRVVRTSTSKA
jgi:hypothetical protein